MPLIDCPECGRAISTEAEACPQCGHPNQADIFRWAGPSCYACSSVATTKCQSCGKFSCARHLQSTWAGRGYELRCRKCYSSAKMLITFHWMFAAVAVAIVLMLLVCKPDRPTQPRHPSITFPPPSVPKSIYDPDYRPPIHRKPINPSPRPTLPGRPSEL